MTSEEIAVLQKALCLVQQLNERVKEATEQLGILRDVASLVLEYMDTNKSKADFYIKVQDLFVDYSDLGILSEIKTVSDLQKHFGESDGK